MGNLANVVQIRPAESTPGHHMADIDDGYTRIANELLDAYAGANITKRQFKVLLAVLRKTYGWNKPMDKISDSQLAEITKLPVKRCNEAKLDLVRMGLLRQCGGMFGPNKNMDEWRIPQIEGESLKTGDKTSLKLRGANPSKQGDTKDTITKDNKNTTQTHEVGLQAEEKLTPRQKGANPRARGTNPRSQLPDFDRERLKNTWNTKATQLGMPKIRSVTATTENGIKRLWSSYLRQCRELAQEPRDIDTVLNGYIEHGYQPTRWACGENPDRKRYGIETALRQEKIDQILGADY